MQNRSLDYFTRVVALVYREIEVLRTSHHRLIASKANLVGGFFGPDRKAQAKQLYKLSLTDTSVTQTLGRYERRTGLTREDVNEAFRDGNWSTASGAFAFGGPKWAAITRTAMQLASAIQGQDWPEVGRLTDLVNTLEHNNGKLVRKFVQLD